MEEEGLKLSKRILGKEDSEVVFRILRSLRSLENDHRLPDVCVCVCMFYGNKVITSIMVIK